MHRRGKCLANVPPPKKTSKQLLGGNIWIFVVFHVYSASCKNASIAGSIADLSRNFPGPHAPPQPAQHARGRTRRPTPDSCSMVDDRGFIAEVSRIHERSTWETHWKAFGQAPATNHARSHARPHAPVFCPLVDYRGSIAGTRTLYVGSALESAWPSPRHRRLLLWGKFSFFGQVSLYIIRAS